MRHFLKVTGKFFGKLIVAKVFGLVLSLTILMALSGTVGSVITQFCSVLILVVIMFSTAWDQGAKDANMFDIRGIKKDGLLGLKAGLVASIPDILMALCLILTKAGYVGSAFPVFYGLFNSVFMPFHQTVTPQTLTVAEHAWIGYVLSAATVLLAPLCAAFGYRLGLLQISLSDTLLYTTPESRERHELKVKERRAKKGPRFFR